jgi:hypothetical protein
MVKSMPDRIQGMKDERDRLNNRIKQLEQQHKENERRARTKRLIEHGAVVESIINGAKEMTKDELAAYLKLNLANPAMQVPGSTTPSSDADIILSDTPEKIIGMPIFTGWKIKNGRVEANQQENILQVFFDNVPDNNVRDELKGSGFRWSSAAMAWQHDLNDDVIEATNRMKCIQPIAGERPADLQRAVRSEA